MYSNMALFLRHNSPYTEDLDRAVRATDEMGIVSKLYGQAMPYWNMDDVGDGEGEEALVLEHFVLIFAIAAGLIILSFAVFFTELMGGRCSRGKQVEDI